MSIKHQIIEQVPPDYYQKGIKNNFFQKYWHTRKLREVNKLITNEGKIKILDVGCASGWFLNEIIKQKPRSKGYGIDIYKEGINYGKKKYPKLILKKANAEKIPFPANTFDIVICTEVLEHVENPSKVLKEIKRVLNKKGIAVIELDSGSILFSIAWFTWKKFNGKVWNDSHLHSFTVKKLENKINKSGLKVESKNKFNFGMAMIFSLTK